MKKEERFGQLLRRRRRECGLTLQDLADALNVSPVFISEVERSTKPPLSPASVELLRYALGDVSDLREVADADRKVVQLDLRNASPAHRKVAMRLARNWTSFQPQHLRRLEEFFGEVESEGGDEKK